MAENKQVRFLQLLNKKTHEGKITWEPTLDEGQFRATFTGYSVYLFAKPAGRSDFDYFVQIFNDGGSLIEEMVDTDFKDFDVEPKIFFVMKETYDLARRQAMGVDEAIDSILSELEK